MCKPTVEIQQGGTYLLYIGNEGISIIENADRLGIPILGFIRDRFLNMKKLNKNKVSA
ncbi:MAG: phage holin family protein [Synergistaceae bacterium]|nr:phage holin family protein [Synergistaceae bacterium]